MTSSGSAASAKDVKPRMSQKTTTISRRWLASRLSSSTTTSANWGERNRRSRPMRSISSTWTATRASSSRFQSAISAAWLRTVSW